MEMINKNKTWKVVICLNPNHITLRFKTNEIGNIECPICGSLMVVELKTNFIELEK
jgi:transcription elongation factor Elf1